MKHAKLIPGLVALLLSVAGLSMASAPVMAQGRGASTTLAQINAAGPGFERYGGPGSDSAARRQPLPDKQLWAIAQSRVPGRIVRAQLQGATYSFRIINQRGSIVDVIVDRYQGRVVSVRGGQ